MYICIFSFCKFTVCLIEVTEVVICQLNRCWEEGIYLDKLIHRFWKLTLQILSRYSSFIDEQIKSVQEVSIYM